jgi:hypothetical protein
MSPNASFVARVSFGRRSEMRRMIGNYMLNYLKDFGEISDK